MAGVSTESLSKVEEVLEAHASLQPLNLASELFAVVDVLDHNGTLRRAVTDSSRLRRQDLFSGYGCAHQCGGSALVR